MIEMAIEQLEQPLADVFRENVQRMVAERGRKAELAKRLGCSPANITLFLKSTDDVKLKTVQDWAAALDVSPFELLKKSDSDS